MPRETPAPMEKVTGQEKHEKRELLGKTTGFINAGGRGARLEPMLTADPRTGITKALLPFGGGSPIIEYHVQRLLNLGVKNIVISAGDHAHLKDSLEKEGILNPSVVVETTEEQEGTGGDLIKAVREHKELGEYVMISNVDTLLDVDEGDVLLHHKNSNADATIVLTRKQAVPNEGAWLVDQAGKVLFTREGAESYQGAEPQEFFYAASSTGTVVINKEVLLSYPWKAGEGTLSLYGDILGKLTQEGRVHAYDNQKRWFVDIGTPDNYKKVMRHPILRKILLQKGKG